MSGDPFAGNLTDSGLATIVGCAYDSVSDAIQASSYSIVKDSEGTASGGDWHANDANKMGINMEDFERVMVIVLGEDETHRSASMGSASALVSLQGTIRGAASFGVACGRASPACSLFPASDRLAHLTP